MSPARILLAAALLVAPAPLASQRAPSPGDPLQGSGARLLDPRLPGAPRGHPGASDPFVAAMRVLPPAEWIRRLDDPRPWARRTAAVLLAGRPQAGAVAALLRALARDRSAPIVRPYAPQTSPEGARAAAAAALGRAGALAAAQGLLDALAHDPSDRVASEAALSLGMLRAAMARVPLERALKDRRPPVRRAAARALGWIGDRRSERALSEAARDSEREVRAVSVEALGRVGGGRAALLTALRDPDPTTRARAAASLGAVGRPEDREALLRSLGDLRRLPPEVKLALVRLDHRIPRELRFGERAAWVAAAEAIRQIERRHPRVKPLRVPYRPDGFAGAAPTP